MLVLVTLFISVSASLPSTAYIKMIDVWMIFNLFIPFFEILLFTYIDNLQVQEEDREINHHGEKRSVKEKSSAGINGYSRIEKITIPSHFHHLEHSQYF